MACQLTMEEREVILQMQAQGCSQSAIAQRLRRRRSTICRELPRNGGPPGGYIAGKAHYLKTERRCIPRRSRKMNDPMIRKHVCRHLKLYWSPDQIAGRLGQKRSTLRISHQTIYAWINKQIQIGGRWHDYLRLNGRATKPRRKTEPAAAPASIEGRPGMINQGRRFGDWEGGTIVGAHHQGGLLSLDERKSRYTFLSRVSPLTADQINDSACQRLRRIPRSLRQSLTFDNSPDFSGYDQLTRRLGIDIYFAEPYCPWQRGTNEHTNGLVRQVSPKGTDLAHTTESKISRAEKLLNDRPRRQLAYKTPAEVFNAKRRVAIVT